MALTGPCDRGSGDSGYWTFGGYFRSPDAHSDRERTIGSERSMPWR